VIEAASERLEVKSAVQPAGGDLLAVNAVTSNTSSISITAAAADGPTSAGGRAAL
jgi:3-hydroxyacyl-CoA dehydrogenase